ncbi:MAG: hypothetical protein IAE82_08760 [Opitutaceae bacterium]|nr:hypothetical protein [Opitutaceae bacterium]
MLRVSTFLSRFALAIAVTSAVLITSGCGGNKNRTPLSELTPPNGGTLVELGEGRNYLEILVDREAGILEIRTLDKDATTPVRTSNEGLELKVAVGAGEERFLILTPIANAATGEFAGNTPLYRGDAPWLKTTEALQVRVERVIVKGKRFDAVQTTVPARPPA